MSLKKCIAPVVTAWLALPCVAAAPSHTLMIEVDEPPAAHLGNRMPASVRIDFREVLKSADARINPQSLVLQPVNADGSPGWGPRSRSLRRS